MVAKSKAKAASLRSSDLALVPRPMKKRRLNAGPNDEQNEVLADDEREDEEAKTTGTKRRSMGKATSKGHTKSKAKQQSKKTSQSSKDLSKGILLESLCGKC